MSKSLRRLAVYASDFRNKIFITKVLLNVTNVFMFSIMQSLKKNLLRSIIMIHCQETLRFKKF